VCLVINGKTASVLDVGRNYTCGRDVGVKFATQKEMSNMRGTDASVRVAER